MRRHDGGEAYGQFGERPRGEAGDALRADADPAGAAASPAVLGALVKTSIRAACTAGDVRWCMPSHAVLALETLGRAGRPVQSAVTSGMARPIAATEGNGSNPRSRHPRPASAGDPPSGLCRPGRAESTSCCRTVPHPWRRLVRATSRTRVPTDGCWLVRVHRSCRSCGGRCGVCAPTASVSGGGPCCSRRRRPGPPPDPPCPRRRVRTRHRCSPAGCASASKRWSGP